MDDFSDRPTSLAEARALKAVDPHLWTPRDALLCALRAIDSGEIKPDKLMICVSEPWPEGQGFSTSFFIAGVDTLGGIGLMEAIKRDMLKP